MGETRIERGAKLDNLIQVAHNVVIGENTVIAAQTGIAGSTRIGRRNMIGGQVGFAGHLEIADDTQWGAQSGVAKSVTKPGGKFMGTPAVTLREFVKITRASLQFAEAMATFHELKNGLEALKKEVERLKSMS